ncbi:hypothetical protein TFLX_03896 [Thermoflexales bacterium]|nr:hypothetical protein TFLX_03896 [Thermoflexales bacterium]
MPKFASSHLAVLVDIAGCPNRCRHCWLGHSPNRRISEETLRRVVQQFREWIHPGETTPFIKPLTVATWYREPDYAANYRDLWNLEQELSDDGAAARFDLLSVWRLARDESYVRWARAIGTQACQITFFGLEETSDYFAGRRGYFKDCLLATHRLLEAGIRPRWQLFLTQQALPELDGFAALIEALHLDQRVQQFGQEFEVFVRTPAPDGAAYHIENVRPTVDALAVIPQYLAEKTRQYNGAVTLEECVGAAEADWIPELLKNDDPFNTYPETLAFMVTPDLDVFSNIGEPMPWWKLGNLQTDGVDQVMQRFENDEVWGLHGNFRVPVSQLAQAYGRPASRLLYARDDLVLRWLREWGEDQWRNRNTPLECSDAS